jgi:hypothetical protein
MGDIEKRERYGGEPGDGWDNTNDSTRNRRFNTKLIDRINTVTNVHLPADIAAFSPMFPLLG